MKIKEGRIPLYFQLYLRIKNDINLKEMPPGALIPSLDELTRIYGVSQTTARKTMELLEREGVIYRKRGQGTFVRKDIEPFTIPIRPLEDEILSSLENLSIHPLSGGWVEAPRRVRSLFSNQPDAFRQGRIYKLQRMRINKRNSRLRRTSDSFLPAWLIDRIDPEQLLYNPVLRMVSRLNITKTINIQQTVRPWICDSEQAELLDIPEGTLLFHLAWRFSGPVERVLWYTEGVSTFNALSSEANIDLTQITADL